MKSSTNQTRGDYGGNKVRGVLIDADGASVDFNLPFTRISAPLHALLAARVVFELAAVPLILSVSSQP